MFRRLSILIGLILAAVLVPAAAAQASNRPSRPHDSVEITKIVYDPHGRGHGKDHGRDSDRDRNLRDEVIVIKNTGRHSVSLRDWTVSDKDWNTYRFRHVWLGRGDKVTLHTGFGRDTSRDVYWDRHREVWDNDRDTAYLRNDHHRLVDVCSYHGTHRGFTFCGH